MASSLYQTKKNYFKRKIKKNKIFFPAPKNVGRPPLSIFLVL